MSEYAAEPHHLYQLQSCCLLRNGLRNEEPCDLQSISTSVNHLCPPPTSSVSSAAGLCGGSASGKTTVANQIIEALDVPWVVLLSMDSFYKVPLTPGA